MRTRTSHIVIHCAATPPSMDIGAKEIDQWHKDRGWKGIGYHYVIRRDGSIENGRHPDEVGAHVRGWNKQSLGICLIGGVDKDNKPENNFTEAQFKSLEHLLVVTSKMYPHAIVMGHRDLDPNKACPSFEVRDL